MLRTVSNSHYCRRGAFARVGLVLSVSAVILIPVICLVVTSFNVADFGQGYRAGLVNWAEVVSQPRLMSALINTVSLAIVQQVLSLTLATIISWLIACTDLPGRRWWEMGFWVALFMPPLPTRRSRGYCCSAAAAGWSTRR